MAEFPPPGPWQYRHHPCVREGAFWKPLADHSPARVNALVAAGIEVRFF